MHSVMSQETVLYPKCSASCLKRQFCIPNAQRLVSRDRSVSQMHSIMSQEIVLYPKCTAACLKRQFSIPNAQRHVSRDRSVSQMHSVMSQESSVSQMHSVMSQETVLYPKCTASCLKRQFCIPNAQHNISRDRSVSKCTA
jgi:hypothetical protein